MRTVGVLLDGPADFPGWRAQARRLLAAEVPPEAVEWRLPGEASGLFATATLLPAPSRRAAWHLSEPRPPAENPEPGTREVTTFEAAPAAIGHSSEPRGLAENPKPGTRPDTPLAPPPSAAAGHLSEHRADAGKPPEPKSSAAPDPALDAIPAPATRHGLGHSSENSAQAGNAKTIAPEAFPAVPATPAPSVPRAFVDLAETAIRHRDPERFALLYRVLWRITHGEPSLPQVATDPDIARLETMAKAVRRDAHKMHAFVRFREIAAADGPRFVSWFEPEHHILEAEAGFFVRRFATMRWSILTPDASAHWDGAALAIGPGGRRADAPAEDAREGLWLAYYASIFNPARLKPGAMRAEMPVKYWRNLPEARLIPRLIAEAPRRMAEMVERGATAPASRRQRDTHWPKRPAAALNHETEGAVAASLSPRQPYRPTQAPTETASVGAGGGTGRHGAEWGSASAETTEGTDQDLRRAVPSPQRLAYPAFASGHRIETANTRPSVPASPRQRNAHDPAQPNAPYGVTGPMPADLFTAAVDPAEGLAALRAEMLSLNSLPPWTADATQMVFGEGPVGAPLLFVGEQPGDEEDIAGKPFVGPAGRMFNKALEEAGIGRGETYVTNAVKHFKFKPTGRRRLHQSPDAGDIAYYRPFLKREIELVGPQLVVTLGATALRALTGKPLAINKTRGEVMPMPDGPPVFPTVHPSYLLRLPDPDSKAREYERFLADLKRAHREVA